MRRRRRISYGTVFRLNQYTQAFRLHYGRTSQGLRRQYRTSLRRRPCTAVRAYMPHSSLSYPIFYTKHWGEL